MGISIRVTRQSPEILSCAVFHYSSWKQLQNLFFFCLLSSCIISSQLLLLLLSSYQSQRSQEMLNPLLSPLHIFNTVPRSLVAMTAVTLPREEEGEQEIVTLTI